MNNNDYHRYSNLVEELGLGRKEDIRTIDPLAGGVSSNIVKVTVGDRTFCLKCALEKLKVEQDWQAPTHRNTAEYAWLEVASRVNPTGSVKLFGKSNEEPCYAMEYIGGSDVYLWKTRLLAGMVSTTEAKRVGESIGRIHSSSTRKEFSNLAFDNRDDFYQLRLDPYLIFTTSNHPQLADVLLQQTERLYEADSVLIHGDVSPKNILFRDGHPIILDAECATMGDPGFDVAFCLNHLILKAAHLPAIRQKLFESAILLWDAYASRVDWEDADQLQIRVCDLLAALMLARIDGKSPVEYLSENNRERVRNISIQLIKQRSTDLRSLLGCISSKLERIA